MNLIITQVDFDTTVPAFITGDDRVFDRMKSFIDVEMANLESVIGPKVDEYLQKDMSYVLHAKRYICTRAAYAAIPQLDLVLTENGFGVVSSASVAPASRDRVAALRDHLRKTSSLYYDILLSDLALFTDWKNTDNCRRIYNSLIFSASSARSNGLHLNGEQIYLEEYHTLKPKIAEAEAALTDIISDELYQALVASLLDPFTELPANYKYVRDLATKYICLYILQQHESHYVALKLQTYLEKYIEEFPDYKNSEVYQANHAEGHENSKTSKCFFW